MAVDVNYVDTQIFIRTYRNLLKSGGVLAIDDILPPYKKLQPSIHAHVDEPRFDISGFMYAYLRLPNCIYRVHKLYLAQTQELFHREGQKVEFWEEVTSPARRRKMYFDGKTTLGVYINSVTDVDDLVCLLASFQIEWNKLHEQLRRVNGRLSTRGDFRKHIKVSAGDWQQLQKICGTNLLTILHAMKHHPLNFALSMIRGSLVDYHKAVQKWFNDLVARTRYHDFPQHPIYFVSSNTHSLVNTMTGWVTTAQKELLAYLRKRHMREYLQYWEKIKSGKHPGSQENFLWYLLKKYEKAHPDVRLRRVAYEQSHGIDYLEARQYLDVNAQIIAVRELSGMHLNKKLEASLKKLAKSPSYIVNIDYPLGIGAYMVLSTVLSNCADVRGVYILGKASFFSGTIGDIGLPEFCQDEHSHNQYVFSNAFTRSSFPEFASGSVLEHQKSVTAKGTLLHPVDQIQGFFQRDFTMLEMEDGPYLNALYEANTYSRYPENAVITLANSPIDLGVIHYASDTPFTKAITLGTRNLGYEGVEATYAASLAILRRIVEQETKY